MLPGRQISDDNGVLTDTWMQYLTRLLSAVEAMTWTGPGRPPARFRGQVWIDGSTPIFVQTPGQAPVWVNASGVVV